MRLHFCSSPDFLQMTQAQVETLQSENQHLRGLQQRLESQSPKVCFL